MTHCPEELELETFVSGSASHDLQCEIAQHVRACDACARWLDEARADEALVPQLRQALHLHGSADSGAHSLLPASVNLTNDSLDGLVVGGYRLLRRLGGGGMGVVYEAEQEHPHRTVALKLVRSSLASQSATARFQREAEVLGRLQHPGIAVIHEAGAVRTAFGAQPFFAMELIRGPTLVDYAAQGKLDIGARIKLMIKVCEAVQHAHQKGVIHRDLKPSNILVAVGDFAGCPEAMPKVLDFGIARVMDAGLADAVADGTHDGQTLGTLSYMSPEQAAGRAIDVDTRSDIYALGLILFELLSGQGARDLHDCSKKEAIERIIAQPPPRLSSLKRELRGDLDTIVQKAVENEPERRYRTAAELAQDLGRYLNAQPIQARPPSVLYLANRFVARHKLAVASAVLFACALTVAGASMAVLYTRAERLRQHAERMQKQAESGADVARQTAQSLAHLLRNLKSPHEAVSSDPGRTESWRLDLLDEAQATVRAGLVHDPETFGELGLLLAETCFWNGRYDQADAMARALLDLWTPAPAAHQLSIASAQHLRGLIHNARWENAEALAGFREAWQIRRAQLGPTHAATLASLFPMVSSLLQQGIPAQAETALVEVFDRLSSEPNALDPELRLLLGRTHLHQGRKEQARRELEAALAGVREREPANAVSYWCVKMEFLGPLLTDAEFEETAAALRELIANPASTADAQDATFIRPLRTLIDGYCRRGDYTSARPLLEKLAESEKNVYGDQHPRYLSAVNLLAGVCWKQGDHQRAQVLYDTAWRLSRQLLGLHNGTTRMILKQLGAALALNEGAEAAAALFREGVADGASEVVLAESLTLAGNQAKAQGRFDDAEDFLLRARALLETRLGPRAPATLQSISLLGSLYVYSGRYADALALYEMLEPEFVAAEGHDSGNALSTASNLGLVLALLGRADEAVAQLRQTKDLVDEFCAGEPARRFKSAFYLAIALRAGGDASAAREQCLEAIEIPKQSERWSDSATDGAAAQLLLGQIEMDLGEFAAAQDALEESIRLYSQYLGSDNYQTALARSHLGRVMAKLGHHAEAVALLRDSLGQIESVHGPSHPRAVQARAALEDALHASAD